nr:unnamed protein product [Spirometra erinaceieuropaei]
MHFRSRAWISTTVQEFLFADDCALNTTSEEEMQRSMDLFSAACENFGLVINTQKTVVMHQPPRHSATAPNESPQISVNGTHLQVVENFPFLGSALSRNSKIDDEVANRISETRQAFGSLQSTATVPRTATDTTTTSPDTRDEDQDYTCPHCDRTFTSHIGLVGHLRIHRTETGEPVREAQTFTHRTRLHHPHCPRTFRHRMGLFGHMRIHEGGLDITPDTPTTSKTSTVHSPSLLPSVRATNTTASFEADTDTADISCPHCPRTFNSRIGLVGPLRIHRTETGEPVPGASTYTHQARLNYPHCPRTFRHRMGLFGHMRIHDDLR